MTQIEMTRRNTLKAFAIGIGGTLSGILSPNAVFAQPQQSSAIVSAANDFLNTLDEVLRSKVTFACDSPERTTCHWTVRSRNGVALKELNSLQRQEALQLLRASTSARGFQKLIDITSLEAEFGRDPALYYVTIFGQPAMVGEWGWRFEGHHLSTSFTLHNGNLRVSPLFLGAWPTEIAPNRVRAGFRTLLDEEEIAWQLLHSLDKDQRRATHVSTTPLGDVSLYHGRTNVPYPPRGLPTSQMNRPQQELLMQLLDNFLGIAQGSSTQLQTTHAHQLNAITFAWYGGVNRKELYSYRLQAPTFILELDNSRNGGTHIHALWQELFNDFS